MNFYYIELNRNDPKNFSTYMICCEEKDLKIKLEDEFECIKAIDKGNGEWQLKGLDELTANFQLSFNEKATKKCHVTKLTKKQLENKFSSINSVFRKGKISEIFQ